MAFGALKMHQHDARAYDELADQFSTFKGGVAALGEQAKKDAAAKAVKDKANKEKADAENKRTTDALRADVERLRDERDRARGSFVPAAPAGARRPDLACFDRAELESAIRGLVTDVRSLVDEGSQATVDLNTAKACGRSRDPGGRPARVPAVRPVGGRAGCSDLDGAAPDRLIVQ